VKLQESIDDLQKTANLLLVFVNGIDKAIVAQRPSIAMPPARATSDEPAMLTQEYYSGEAMSLLRRIKSELEELQNRLR
jgi:hypothetical protein